MTTTRPRTAGLDLLRRQSIRPYYEPFTPKVEEREENEAHILQLLLPNFDGQQVKVQIDEAGRSVAVTGDRYMGNNRWIRLDKTYPVPQNCIVDKIERKFENGILTVTMPKETPPLAAAVVEAEAAVAPPPKEDEQTIPEKGKEDTSQEDAVQPDPKTETQAPEMALPKVDSNASSAEKPSDDDKNKSAVLEKQVSGKVKEETLAPAAVEPTAEKNQEEEAKLTPKQGESGMAEDQKPTQKEEIKDKIPEMEKEESKSGEESKTETVGSKPETTPTPTPAPAPAPTTTPIRRAVRAAKLAGRFAVVKLPLPMKANLAAAVVIVAAYFAYTYYRLPAN